MRLREAKLHARWAQPLGKDSRETPPQTFWAQLGPNLLGWAVIAVIPWF